MSLLNLLTECETGTIFLDSHGRIWEYKRAWDSERTGYLVGITKDTPTFTFKQLRGISVDGFRQAGKEEYSRAVVAKKFEIRALNSI